jgi:hypothetical protein
MSTQTTTKPKPFCFVLMPFDSSFNDIYEFGIKGACEDAGLYCERVDEQIFVGSMLERIYNQIARADLLVADMTGKNPNVFYEVGYAHALGKNVVLLTSVAQDIPFDLKHFPHIVYGSEIKTLRTLLAKRLQHLASEKPTRSDTQIGLDLFLMDARLIDTPGTVVTYSRDNDRGARPEGLTESMSASPKCRLPGCDARKHNRRRNQTLHRHPQPPSTKSLERHEKRQNPRLDGHRINPNRFEQPARLDSQRSNSSYSSAKHRAPVQSLADKQVHHRAARVHPVDYASTSRMGRVRIQTRT